MHSIEFTHKSFFKLPHAGRTVLPLKIIAFLSAGLLFAGANYQQPLFTSNQNTYFLHGLAQAGYGYLSADWLANQTDHIPAFSWIVYLVHRYAIQWGFYLIFSLIAATYAGSLAIICGKQWENRQSLLHISLFFTALTLLHCAWVWVDLTDYIPSLWTIILTFHSNAPLFINGVADQYILGSYLQPASFGAFLITSVACFVHKKMYLSILFALTAATIHPTYVLHAGVLTAAYMIALSAEKQTRKAIAVGALAALLVTPIILYVILELRPTNALILQKAHAILTEERIPHHAKVSMWFSRDSCIQIAIILAGIMASYRNKRLSWVLAVSLTVGAVLSYLQFATGSTIIALLFPWRMSTWLVTISTAILLGKLITGIVSLMDRLISEKWLRGVRICIVCICFAFIAESAFLGASKTISFLNSKREPSFLTFIKKNAKQGQTYLVPLAYENFRLASGLPIFVDWKSHPYRDNEVLEWYDRVALAKAFYNAKTGKEAAQALALIQKRTLISHIILEATQDDVLNSLPHWRQIFRDGRRILLELKNG